MARGSMEFNEGWDWLWDGSPQHTAVQQLAHFTFSSYAMARSAAPSPRIQPAVLLKQGQMQRCSRLEAFSSRSCTLQPTLARCPGAHVHGHVIMALAQTSPLPLPFGADCRQAGQGVLCRLQCQQRARPAHAVWCQVVLKQKCTCLSFCPSESKNAPLKAGGTAEWLLRSCL